MYRHIDFLASNKATDKLHHATKFLESNHSFNSYCEENMLNINYLKQCLDELEIARRFKNRNKINNNLRKKFAKKPRMKNINSSLPVKEYEFISDLSNHLGLPKSEAIRLILKSFIKDNINNDIKENESLYKILLNE